MMNWCAYCQQFQGEKPPYHNHEISHGMCAKCATKGLDLTEDEFSQALKLKKFQDKLLNAGLNEDLDAADAAIEEALAFGARPVDILMGLIAPALMKVGALWAEGKVSIAQEHRFTAFYNAVLGRIEAIELSRQDSSRPTDILLVNVDGNAHSLGTRFINLKLLSEGIHSRVIGGRPNLEVLVKNINEFRPRYLGISIAIAEQVPNLVRLIEELPSRLPDRCPKILIGGHAVKMGYVREIKGAILEMDLEKITTMIRAS